MKIVINKFYSSLVFSDAVLKELGISEEKIDFTEICNDFFNITSSNEYAYRAHPKLIAAVEKVGLKNTSCFADDIPVIVILPDDTKWKLITEDAEGTELVLEEGHYW